MKEILIFLSAGFLLFIQSCSKDDEKTTVVSGIVIQSGNKQPLDSVRVTLLDGVSTANDPIFPGQTASGCKNVAYTDKNGYFRVEITGEYGPFISLAKDKYWPPYGGEIIPMKWGADNAGKVFEMDAPSLFLPTLIPLFNTTQTTFYPLRYINYNDKTGYEETWDGSKPRLLYETMFGLHCIGDKYLRYRLVYVRNGNTFTKLDSVYIKAFETYRDTIYY